MPQSAVRRHRLLLLSLFLGLGALLAACAAQPAATPTLTFLPSPTPSRTAPPSATAAASQLPTGTARPTPTPTSQLTPTSPAPPDGLIVFSAGFPSHQLFVTNVDGSALAQITHEEGIDHFVVAWLPDGAHILYETTPTDGILADGVWLIGIDGTGQRKLSADLPSAGNTSLSPDGNHVVFTAGPLDNSDLYLVDVSTGGITRLTDDPAQDAMPAWSPDGRRIAYISTRTGYAEIYLMEADGSELVQLTRQDTTDKSWPVWSPDGSQLAVTVHIPLGSWVSVLDVTSGTLRRVTEELFADSPIWSPNSRELVFTASDLSLEDHYTTDIYRVDASEGIPRLITNSTEALGYRAQGWTFDGQWVIASVEPSAAPASQMLLFTPDGATTLPLPVGEVSAVCCALWQPAPER